MDWRTKYIAFFGDISAQRAKAYEDVICEKVRSIRPGELENAIESIYKSWATEEDNRSKPSINKIINKIFELRGVGTAADENRERERRLYSLKKEIDRAARIGDFEAIWEAICAPNDIRECEFLESYAKSSSIDISAVRAYIYERRRESRNLFNASVSSISTMKTTVVK